MALTQCFPSFDLMNGFPSAPGLWESNSHTPREGALFLKGTGSPVLGAFPLPLSHQRGLSGGEGKAEGSPQGKFLSPVPQSLSWGAGFHFVHGGKQAQRTEVLVQVLAVSQGKATA